MLDFCRPWHTSWLWIWSERAVGCSTWNRVPGSCGGGAAHGPDVRAAGGGGGSPRAGRPVFWGGGGGGFFGAPFWGAPRRRLLGCLWESTPPREGGRGGG